MITDEYGGILVEEDEPIIPGQGDYLETLEQDVEPIVPQVFPGQPPVSPQVSISEPSVPETDEFGGILVDEPSVPETDEFGGILVDEPSVPETDEFGGILVDEPSVPIVKPRTDTAVERGIKQTISSLIYPVEMAEKDYTGAARNIVELQKYIRENPSAPEIEDISKAWERGEGAFGTINELVNEFRKDVTEAPTPWEGLKATAKNVKALGDEVIEMIPAMIVPTLSGVAGGFLGAAAGSEVPVIGPAIGGVAGTFGGASAGNAMAEAQSIAISMMNKAGVDLSNEKEIAKYLEDNSTQLLRATAKKGSVLGAFDTMSLKLTSFILKGAGRAATKRALAKMGVNKADKLAVKEAVMSPTFKKIIASDKAFLASEKGLEKIARHATAATLEPLGEGLGEYIGSGIALGDWDAKNAILEAMATIGQSAITFGGQKIHQTVTGPISRAVGVKAPTDTTMKPTGETITPEYINTVIQHIRDNAENPNLTDEELATENQLTRDVLSKLIDIPDLSPEAQQVIADNQDLFDHYNVVKKGTIEKAIDETNITEQPKPLSVTETNQTDQELAKTNAIISMGDAEGVNLDAIHDSVLDKIKNDTRITDPTEIAYKKAYLESITKINEQRRQEQEENNIIREHLGLPTTEGVQDGRKDGIRGEVQEVVDRGQEKETGGRRAADITSADTTGVGAEERKPSISRSGEETKKGDRKIRESRELLNFREDVQKVLKNQKQTDAIISIMDARAKTLGMTTDRYIQSRNISIVPDSRFGGEGVQQKNKGAIEGLDEGKAIIHAFKSADVSTLIHEIGHVFRRDLTDKELTAAEEWVGAKPGATWTVAQEEKFARGWENYITMGKAPNMELRSVFEKLKAWMLEIYGSLTHPDINIEISPEIRKVFDSLVSEPIEFKPDVSVMVENPHRQAMTEAINSGGIDLNSAKLMFSHGTIAALVKKRPGLFVKEGGSQVGEIAGELGYDSADNMIESWTSVGTKKAETAKSVEEQRREWDLAEDAMRGEGDIDVTVDEQGILRDIDGNILFQQGDMVDILYQSETAQTTNLNATIDGVQSDATAKHGAEIIAEMLRKLEAVAVPSQKKRFDDTVLAKLVTEYRNAMDYVGDPLKTAAEKQRYLSRLATKVPQILRSKLLSPLAQIASVKSGPAQNRRVEKFMRRADTEMTNYLRKEMRDKITKVIKPLKKRKGIQRGRGYRFERDLKYIREHALDFDDIRIESEINEQQARIAKKQELIANPKTSNRAKANATESIADAESRIVMADLFGDLNNKTFDETLNALKALEEMIADGRASWRAVREAEQARNARNATLAIASITGDPNAKPEDVGAAARREERRKKPWGKIKELMSVAENSIMSWEIANDKISSRSGKGTLKSWLVKHMSSVAHYATRNNDIMQQEEHGKILDKATKIFKAKNNVALGKIFAKLDKVEDNKVFVYPDGNESSVPLSPLQGAYWYALWKARDQRNVGDTFKEMGVTEDTISDIEKLMSPELKEYADWIVDEYLQEFHDGINEVHREMYGIDLAKTENYMPLHREVTGKAEDKQREGLLAGKTSGSIAKGGLHARVYNTKRFKRMNINDVLVNHVTDMNHFKAWALPSREINGVFNRPEIQGFIKQYYGPSSARMIRFFQDRFVQSPNEIYDQMQWLDRWRGKVATSMVGANPVVFFKQLTSMPAFAADIPVTQWVKHSTYALRNPVKAWKLLSQSPMLKARGMKGHDKDVVAAGRATGGGIIAGTRTLPNRLMVLTMLGDKMAIIAGGYPVYKYHYDQSIKGGMDTKQAHEKAIVEFERSFSRSQQSSNVQDLGWFLQKDPMTRMFTLFMTSPASYSRQIFLALRHMKDDPKDAIKRFGIYGVVLPAMFQIVADALLIASPDDDDQERAIGNTFGAIAKGPMNGLPIIRTVAGGAYEASTGNQWMMNQSFSPMTEIAKTPIKAVYYGGRAIREDDDEYFAKMMWEIWNSAGIITGMPTKNVKRIWDGLDASLTGETDHPLARFLGYSEYAVGE